ncbi:MAG: hypothetical protein COB30_002955 [Ectothiorhodospiraceae bacterium]|nr:hypothetical protein [Ectothiorhodospiraceae bacterium]
MIFSAYVLVVSATNVASDDVVLAGIELDRTVLDDRTMADRTMADRVIADTSASDTVPNKGHYSHVQQLSLDLTLNIELANPRQEFGMDCFATLSAIGSKISAEVSTNDIIRRCSFLWPGAEGKA